MIQNVLQNIGLNQKEIKVYLIALEIGTQPASVIGRKVALPRNTTRFLLDKLVDKGLIKKSTKANTQLYTPEEPKNLINLLERQRVDSNASIDEKIKQLNEFMAELETRYHPESTKPKVTFYEGDDGLIKVYEDTLTSSETIRSFASFDVMHGVLPDYFKTYYKRRAENKIMIRSIHPDTSLAIEKTKNDKKEWRDSRLISKDKYNFNPEIQFYDNKVIITSWKERLGILIESREIYQAMTVAFELAWNEAGRSDKRKK
jgi:HTH-type transcriptional regulator, sugar sensing transcriptional regulator